MTKLSDKDGLRRYTSLPVLLDILVNKHLAFGDPDAWDDQNDREAIRLFRSHYGHDFVGAICLTRAAETIHHWQIYAPGSAGVCIVFNKGRLIDLIKNWTNIKFGDVKYYTLQKVRKINELSIDDIPFAKRWGFKDEGEVRILSWGPTDCQRKISLPITEEVIDRVVFSPFSPPNLVESCRSAINQLQGWLNLRISHSNLIDNKQFQDALKSVPHLRLT